MSNENGSFRIPLGLTGVLVTVGLSFTGFWGLWSVARADVDNLKTRVASLPATPDRTASQLKTAIKNKINAGSAD